MRFDLPIHAIIRSCGLTLISLMPIWVRPAANHPVLRAFVPVLVTYLTSAIGGAYLIKLTSAEDLPPGPDPNEALGLWFGTGAFTLAHMVIPAIVYLAYVLRDSDEVDWGCLLYLYTAAWFGAPIIALAAWTGWLPLIAAAVHLVLAQPRERHWVFVEYGSTSFALLLFVLDFGGANLCVGLPIVVFQSLLLSLMAVWGRKIVVGEHAPLERPEPPPKEVSSSNRVPIASAQGRQKQSNRKRRRSRKP